MLFFPHWRNYEPLRCIDRYGPIIYAAQRSACFTVAQLSFNDSIKSGELKSRQNATVTGPSRQNGCINNLNIQSHNTTWFITTSWKDFTVLARGFHWRKLSLGKYTSVLSSTCLKWRIRPSRPACSIMERWRKWAVGFVASWLLKRLRTVTNV